jgi:GH24 family phage-related lysozyme (muramidase)
MRQTVVSALFIACLIVAAPAQAAPPANDNFANAVALASPPSEATGNNTEATTQANEPSAHGGASVWWKWTADQAGRFRVDVCDTLPAANLRMAVYTGTSVGALTNVTAAVAGGGAAPLAYAHGACADGQLPSLVFDAAVGQTYHIAVGSDGSGSGTTSTNIVLKLRKSEAGDNFAEAIDAGAVPAQVTGSNVFASPEQSEPDGHGDASVWWKWTADQSGRYRADVCDTLPAANLRMGVYTGSSVNALANATAAVAGGGEAPLFYEHGACADNQLPSAVFDAAAGQTYYIAVGADGCCSGTTSPNIVLKLRKSEANDNLAEALELVGAPASATGSSVFASLESFEPDDHGGASIWWRWTAPRGGPFTVHTCKTQPDANTKVRVYTGEAVSALTSVPATISPCGAGKLGERARFEANAGQTYLFAVGADGCCTGSTSPGIALTLRDTDCDAANARVRKAKNRVAALNKALKQAKARGKRGKVRSLRNKLKKARGKVTTAKQRRTAAC